jgi:UDP-N-acetylmuramyl pentapeptide phosphotransferase/UDP-N-acetylglucosamine-1-phosphate transferase
VLNSVLIAATSGLIASIALVAAVRSWARQKRVLDHPNARSLHVEPTPRGGGIGIVVPVSLGLFALSLVMTESRPAALWLGGAALLMACVGFADDLRGLPAMLRLAAHLFGAGLIVVGIGTWDTIEWPGIVHVGLAWAAIPFTVLIVAGLTNAYNFMDGIDGIAGSQGVIAGLAWIGAAYALDDPLVGVTGALIASTSLGFLCFNWPPASIFMGDVGTSFMGFLLGALAVYAATRAPETATASILAIWPFVFDTAFTLARRAIRGERLMSAHRSHLYQRLVLTGVSHRATTSLYTVLASVGAIVGIAVREGSVAVSIGGAVLIALMAAGLWAAVVWRERARS